jgi:hypothetical protein
VDRRQYVLPAFASRLLINSTGSLQGMQACFQVLALDDPPSALPQIRQALTLLGGDHTSTYRLQNPVQIPLPPQLSCLHWQSSARCAILCLMAASVLRLIKTRPQFLFHVVISYRNAEYGRCGWT